MPEKTLAEIDAELEKEFFSVDDDVELVEVEPEDEAAESLEDEPTEEVEVEEKPEVPQEKKVDKQEFAWKELRTKNQQLQSELETSKQAINKLEQMAKSLGYESANELLKRYDDEQVTKEAETKGVDPAFYKEFKQMQSELELTKQQKAEQAKQVQIQNFANTLDTLAKENGLTETEKQQIIQQLEADGYTIEDIVAIKSPSRLLTGYMVDKIAERKVQTKLKTQKKEAFVDEKHNGSAEVTENDLEKTIADEMKQYARSMGYKL